MKDKIQQELDNNRLFAVQYGFVIIAAVIILSFLALYTLKIDGDSVLYWFYKSYIK